jgi:hypothetical protein
MKSPTNYQIHIWIRVSIMVGALIAVFYSINYLQKNPVAEILLNPGGITRGNLNLCPTRVAEVTLAEPNRRIRYYNQGVKWMFEGPSNFEISELFMEKWLAHHCTIHIDEFLGKAPETAQYPYVLIFKYVDGKEFQLKRADKGVFLIDGEHIKSSQLEEAVTLLDPELITR